MQVSTDYTLVLLVIFKKNPLAQKKKYHAVQQFNISLTALCPLLLNTISPSFYYTTQ